jgi:YD repeat-containing protein
MARKEVLDGAGAVVERSDLEWARSMPISDFRESGSSFRTHVALLKSRSVVRAGSSQTYATVNTYDERPYRADRASNFNDFGRPKEVLETGELTRRTSRTFFYGTGADPSFTTFIADKTASETVEVGGESFTSSWKYEAATGFTKSQTINGITTTFSRDDYGNVASATDANGNLDALTYPSGGKVTYQYDGENRITRVANGGGGVVFARAFAYHPSGALDSFRAGNSLLHRFTYDNRYRLKTLNSGGELSLGYSYDRFGNVLGITDSRSGMNQTFSYDSVDRLETASGVYGALGFESSRSWLTRLSRVLGKP